MKYYKKTAAFLTGLLVALSATAPAFTAFAEDSDTVMVIDDDGNVYKEEEEEKTEYEAEGFKYTVNDDDTLYIIGATDNTGEVLSIPASIDGKKVGSVSGSAFLRMNAKKVVIPADAEYDLSENPFAPCIMVEEYVVEEGNRLYTSVDGVLFSKDKKVLYCYPAAQTAKSYSIPEGTEEICIAAFYKSDMENLTVPASVTALNRHSFCYMDGLKKADLSAMSIETLPAMTFTECSSLTEIIFPETLKNIEVGCFMNCSSLEDVNLPESLEKVGQSAFMGTAMKKVIIPDKVSEIGYNAFGYENEEYAVDDFVMIGTAGGAAALYANDEDTEYDYKNEFKFYTTENYQKQLQYEAMNVQESGDYSYSVNDDGTAILVACNTVTSKTEVPAEIDGHTITSVFTGAFMGCYSTEIVLPDTITSIDEDAFSTTVECITLPGGLLTFESDEPFVGCPALKSISTGEGDGNFSAENGVLYNKDKTLVVCYPQAKEDKKFSLPKTVVNTALSSFCYNEFIEEIDLSNAELISDYSFEGCTSLKKVKLSKNLKSIGNFAFLGCTSLTSLRVYENVETIGIYSIGYDYDDELEADMEANPDNYKDEDGNVTTLPYSLYDGFRLYAAKDSLAELYAGDCGIEVITNSVSIGSTNIDMRFFYLIGGIAGLGIITAVTGTVSKKMKNKKKK